MNEPDSNDTAAVQAMMRVAKTLAEPHMRDFLAESLKAVQDESLGYQYDISQSAKINGEVIAAHYCTLQGQLMPLQDMQELVQQYDASTASTTKGET